MLMTVYDFKRFVDATPKDKQAEVIEQARVVVKVQRVETCKNCGGLFPLLLQTWDDKRRYCDNACKQAAYRKRKAKR